MDIRFQSVFRALSPYRILVQAGYQVQEVNGVFWTCRKNLPDVRYYLTDTSVVAELVDADFVAGSAYDFLRLDLGSYDKVVDHVLLHHVGEADMPGQFDLKNYRSSFIVELKSSREFFQRWLDLRKNLRDGLVSPEVTSWLRRMQLDPNAIWRVVYVSKGLQLNATLGLTERLLDPDKDYAVLPMWLDYHRLGSIRIWEPWQPTPTRTHSFDSRQPAIFGLHTTVPDGSEIRIYSSELLAVQELDFRSRHAQKFAGCVSVMAAKDNKPGQPVIGQASFIATPDTGLEQALQAKAVTRKLRILASATGFTGDGPVKEWLEYMIIEFQRRMRKREQQPSEFINCIDQLKLDSEAYLALCRWLESTRMEDVLQLVKARGRNRVVLERDNLVISSSDDGYVATRVKSGTKMVFTNFTLQVQSVMWVPDTQEMFYSCLALVQGQQVRLNLSSRGVNNARDIEMTVALAAAKQGVASVIPVILDASLGRNLTAILKAQAVTAFRQTAHAKLGWNSTRTAFIAGNWEVDSVRHTDVVRLFHPFKDVLFTHYFDVPFSDSKPEKEPLDYSVFCMVFGAIGRAMFTLTQPKINVMQSADSEWWSHAVFAALGQKRAIDLNPNIRYGQIDSYTMELGGMPYLARCNSESLIPKIPERQMLFVLSRFGQDITLPESSVFTYDAAVKHFQTLFKQGLTELCRGKAGSFDFATALPTHLQLMHEGRRLFKTLTGIGLPLPEATQLYEWMAGITDCRDQVRFDLPTQTFTILVGPLKDVTFQAGAFQAEYRNVHGREWTIPETSSSLLDPVVGVRGVVQR